MPTFENFRSGGPHSKAFGLLRGKQKARIFVYPVGPALFGKRAGSFGARPRFLPRSERKAFCYWGSAAAEFRFLLRKKRRKKCCPCPSPPVRGQQVCSLVIITYFGLYHNRIYNTNKYVKVNLFKRI